LKVISILGARPQFVKAAAISRAIETLGTNNQLEHVLLHTGQHFDHAMSEVFFTELGIPQAAYNLNINCLNHGAMTGRMIEQIETILLDEKPDCVLVYGDTNSTAAGAFASAKLHMPVAHLEAGLRSYNRRMPEETNRVITDHCSDILFCPTEKAIEMLNTEGIVDGRHGRQVILSGDVMYDCCLHYKQSCRPPSEPLPEKFILATIHRGENLESEDRIHETLDCLEVAASSFPIIMPAHPRTNKTLKALDRKLSPAITTLAPFSYLEMLYALGQCEYVITDSGGLQKEAFFMEKKCITLRKETEWVELVEIAANTLVKGGAEEMKAAIGNMSDTKVDWDTPLYGNGKASEVIIEELIKSYS